MSDILCLQTNIKIKFNVEILVGPFNTAYRMLRMHLRLANLNSLFNSVDANAWPLVYDCNTCLETTSAGAGSSHGTVAFDDSLSSGLSTLPRPPDTVTTIQSPYKFSVVTIPYYPENQPFEVTLIVNFNPFNSILCIDINGFFISVVSHSNSRGVHTQ